MRFDKIYGALAAAAIGDAMGAATEIRSRDAITGYFGGWVEEFRENPPDVFLRGMPAGFATDDFSLAYHTARAIVKHGGVSEQAALDALLSWSETEYYRFAGPSTKRTVDRIKGIFFETEPEWLVANNSRATNGSAMKISPVGLANIGNPKKAAADSIIINRITHNNRISLAAGAAVAAAVAYAATENPTIEKTVEWAANSARFGYAFGDKLAGPNIEKRIRLAAVIGKRYKGDIYGAAAEIGDIIGSGLMAAEAVPAAIGLFVAADGDPYLTILGGVNIGDDTDTVATISGAISGAFSGAETLPVEWIERVESVNGFDLKKLARELCEL